MRGGVFQSHHFSIEGHSYKSKFVGILHLKMHQCKFGPLKNVVWPYSTSQAYAFGLVEILNFLEYLGNNSRDILPLHDIQHIEISELVGSI